MVPINGYSQNNDLESLYPFSTLQSPSILELGKNWETLDRKDFRVPFYDEQIDKLSIQSSFVLDCTPPDSIFLYLEGVSWQVEVELNSRYLGSFLRPFASIAIPIHKSWLNETENLLSIDFSKGQQLSFHPSPFIAMLKVPRLVDKEQLAYLKQEVLHTETIADTVALIAPYYQGHTYYFELNSAYRMLRHLQIHNIHHVYFLYAPSRELMALCAQLGLKQVEKITSETYTFFLNDYPYDAWQMINPPHFWLDKFGGRTENYEVYRHFNQSKINKTPLRTLLIWLILLPIVGLLLIKLLNPSFFYSLPSIFTTPKLFIDNFSDASYANLTLIFILQLIKVLSLAATISMIIYYIQQAHQWYILTIFRAHNLLETIFHDTDSLFRIFSKAVFLLSGWLIIRYFLNIMLGNIYKIKGLALGALNLDIVGSYPLILLLSTPIALLIFSNTQWNPFFVTILVILTSIYVLRKLYVFYIGLDRLFSFSLGVKILYICALNIIPYMILF